MDNNNICLKKFFEIIQKLCPKHVINQWLLSLYVVKKNDTSIDIIQYSESLTFPNGFELFLIFNPCKMPNVLVYVNDCVLQCDSFITGIQLHKHECNNIRIVGEVPLKLLCVLFRRVPLIKK